MGSFHFSCHDVEIREQSRASRVKNRDSILIRPQFRDKVINSEKDSCQHGTDTGAHRVRAGQDGYRDY